MNGNRADDGPGTRAVEESRRWRLSAGAGLAARVWSGEYVVHHALSNETHRLNELAGRILLLLGRQAAGDVRLLADELNADGKAVAEVLEALSLMNLVTRC